MKRLQIFLILGIMAGAIFSAPVQYSDLEEPADLVEEEESEDEEFNSAPEDTAIGSFALKKPEIKPSPYSSPNRNSSGKGSFDLNSEISNNGVSQKGMVGGGSGSRTIAGGAARILAINSFTGQGAKVFASPTGGSQKGVVPPTNLPRGSDNRGAAASRTAATAGPEKGLAPLNTQPRSQGRANVAPETTYEGESEKVVRVAAPDNLQRGSDASRVDTSPEAKAAAASKAIAGDLEKGAGVADGTGNGATLTGVVNREEVYNPETTRIDGSFGPPATKMTSENRDGRSDLSAMMSSENREESLNNGNTLKGQNQGNDECDPTRESAIAQSTSNKGKAFANAFGSNCGGAFANATRGTQAGAVAQTLGSGDARANSETNGAGGATSLANAMGSGKATGTSSSGGTGNARSVALSNTNDALAKSRTSGGGSADSTALSSSGGSAKALSKTLKGGGARSDAGATGGGDARATAITDEGVFARARSSANKQGNATSKAQTSNGDGEAEADAIAEDSGKAEAEALSDFGDASDGSASEDAYADLLNQNS